MGDREPRRAVPPASNAASDAPNATDSKAATVVFARLPVPGRVKTRLAAGAGVGPDGACEFYKACAEHALHQAASCRAWADVFVFHSSCDSTAKVEAWLAREGLELPCLPQLGAASGAEGGSDPDLGAKMLAAMREAQRRSGHRKVLITGTDIPDLSEELLRRAADALDEHEVVLGPAEDGGYYLLGLTRLEGSLFQGMRWSTDSVLRDTLARAAAAELRVAPLATLPPLRDVDTVQDLAEWVACCECGAVEESRHQPEAQCWQQPLLQQPLPVQEPAIQGREGTGEGATERAATDGSGGHFDILRRRKQELLEVSKAVLERAAEALGSATGC